MSLQYPAFEFIPFEYMSDMQAYVGYIVYTLNNERFEIPIVFTLTDLMGGRNKVVGMFSSIFKNALDSSHDVVDSRLHRGEYAI